MKQVMTRVLTGAALIGMAATAHAADFGGPEIVPPPPEPVHHYEPYYGGWYLRGDIGVGIQEFDGLSIRPGIPAGFGRQGDRLGDPAFIGAGVGYQFNKWFRTDITATYRGAEDFGFSYLNAAAGPPAGFAGNIYTGNLSTLVALWNVYVDGGNYYGLTPYLGAGVGFAYHWVRGFNDFGVGNAAGAFGFAGSQETASFAWAVHAGLAYDINERLKLDLGYSFTHMGEADLGTIACQGGCGGPSFSYKFKNVYSHDLRLGMRWTFHKPPPPEPIVAKF